MASSIQCIYGHGQRGASEDARKFLSQTSQQIKNVSTEEALVESIDMRSRRDPFLILIEDDFACTTAIPDMIRRLRMRTPAPIIILGMSLAPVQKATFLEAGADDVMDVSWSVTEIAFRLQKFKERTHEQLYIHTTLSHGPVKLHVRSHTVSIDSKHVHLTQTEYRILEYLLFHKDQNIPRERLASATLPLQSSMKYNTQRLLVHLSNLRKKLAGSLTIRTLPDGSYKLL